MTPDESESFLESALEIGRRMIRSGAEVRRAEDAVSRLSAAYGFDSSEVFATTTQMLATIKDREGRHYTQSVRIFFTANDLGELESLDELMRSLCAGVPPVSEIRNHLKRCSKPNRPLAADLAGHVLAAGAFAVFFGGTLSDGLSAALIAVAVVAMDRVFRLRNMHRILHTVIACFISGCLSLALVRLGLGSNADKVMIGVIMLFIPALAAVNGVQEMFHRDIMTGLFRLTEALLAALAIAIGFAASIMLLGGGHL